MGREELLRGLIAGFLSEAQEICEAITHQLLAIEGGASGDPALTMPLDEIARGLHTLKGSAGSLGLEDIATLAHRMEDVISPLRRANQGVPPTAVDAILKGLDAFLARLRAHVQSSPMLPDLGPALALISAAVPASASSSELEGPLSSPVSGIGEALRRSEITVQELDEGERSWRIAPRDVLLFMREVERLREVRLRLDEREREIERVLQALAFIQGTAEAQSHVAAVRRAIEVDAGDVLDIVDALEERVKAIGTQPVSTIVEPLRRLVRDSCRSAGKEARLSVVGGELSLDRHVLRGLRESLVHFVRNAVDHGIELPRTREGSGKYREGLLVLRLEQHGNVLYVEFSDDGAGLDAERLRQVAIQNHLATRAELASLEPRELFRLIFGAGFSTSTKVTESSGRGVGLDVVRRWVESLRGHIEVYSAPGEGTRFTLTIPAEFGSSPIIVVGAADQRFGIPIAVIERVLPAGQAKATLGQGSPKLEYEERLLPWRDLGASLGLRSVGAASQAQPAVIVQSQGSRLAVAVDEILEDQELVIRALPREVADVSAFQGASTTARGELLLILRPSWLVETTAEEVPRAPRKRALVIDDSLTARALHRAMLEAGGYVVHAVSAATQALEWLAHAAYDVVVCDLAMAPMDGLAFIAAVRSHPTMKRTPIVLVSAREDHDVRERGLQSGADAFLTKGDCARGRLLAEVSALVSSRRGGSA